MTSATQLHRAAGPTTLAEAFRRGHAGTGHA